MSKKNVVFGKRQKFRMNIYLDVKFLGKKHIGLNWVINKLIKCGDQNSNDIKTS